MVAKPPRTPTVERVDKLKLADLHHLCDATDQAIREGGGFGWVEPPSRDTLERYWRGVLLIPDRSLFVGRLDGVIAGSVQLARPSRHNEAQSHAATVTTIFVASWARGNGLARRLVEAAEAEARWAGFLVLNLDLRANHVPALRLFESLGFHCWGSHPYYASVRGETVAGLFYYKELTK
ncbi:MAG: GNAT family N-acetyltransferase [Rhodospirillaceae bacterium]